MEMDEVKWTKAQKMQNKMIIKKINEIQRLVEHFCSVCAP